MLHGTRVLEAQVAGVASGRSARGHRLGTDAVEVPSADAYVEALRAAGVTADHEERARAIAEAVAAAAADAGAAWSDPRGVLDEVVQLVERPHVVRGSIDERFRALPDRVLVTAMQSHQRYLPLTVDGVRIGFLTVVNSNPAADDTVRQGNERVLRGRLEDAEFSLARDLERGLEAFGDDLARITYHQKAGSVHDRVGRIEALAATICDAAGVAGDERAHALAAARLAKNDLATTMVGEFADLQGYVGMEYARRAGLPDAVATAIGEQYRPDGAGAALPETVPGAVVALADKLDALATLFAVGERPTGSRDPFALRRAASGVFEILRSRGWRLDLRAVAGADGAAFVLDRADTWLEGQGVPVDVVRCARGLADRTGDVVAHVARARALAAAADGDAFARVHAAWTRCHRLARRSAEEAAHVLDPLAFEDATEGRLADRLLAARGPVEARLESGDVAGALEQAAAVAPVVDEFFDAVLVMHDEPAVRANRLRLLGDVTDLMERFGDLSQVQR